MDQTVIPQYILRLPGISLSEYKSVEDTFDERLESELQEDSAPVTYDKVPVSFNGLKTWPKQTNLKCVMCDRTFREIPKFYAKDLAKDATGNIEMSPIRGFMCSFACVSGYIEHLPLKKDEKWRAFEVLYLAYKIFTGEDVKHILPAPDKTEREEYGGLWGMEKFIDELKMVDKWIDKNPAILERAKNSETLDALITNAVLTGQIKNGNEPAAKETETESRWENAFQTKFDGVAYD
jgi:hypothetical protein